MKRSFIRIILVLVILFCLTSLGLIYGVLSSPRFMEKFISWYWRKSLARVPLTSLSITHLQYDFPGQIFARGINMGFQWEQEPITIHLDSLLANIVPRFMKNQWDFELFIQGLDITFDQGKVMNIQAPLKLVFRNNNLEEILAQVQIASLIMGKYELTQISGELQGKDPGIQIDEIEGYLYSGQLKGKFSLDYREGITYIIELAMTDVNLQQLEKIEPDFFSQVRGIINGQIQVKGDLRKIQYLEGRIQTKGGGHLKANILRPLLDVLPQSTQRKDLAQLINFNGDVPLENVQIDFKSLTEEQLQSRFYLVSQRFNLDADITVDLNIEGGLKSLLSYMAAWN